MSKDKQEIKVYVIKEGIDYMLKTLQGTYLAKRSLERGKPSFTLNESLAIKRLDRKSILDIAKIFGLKVVKTKRYVVS